MIPKISPSLSAITIDTPGPNPSARDTAPRCPWSLSRSNPCPVTDLNVVDVSVCKTLLKNPNDLKRPHGYWEYDQPTQSAKGEESLAQSAKMLTSMSLRASDSHIVRLWTRGLGPWLGLFFEARTALGRGTGTFVQLVTKKNPHKARSAFCYLRTVRMWRSTIIMQFQRHYCVRRTRDACLQSPDFRVSYVVH